METHYLVFIQCEEGVDHRTGQVGVFINRSGCNRLLREEILTAQVLHRLERHNFLTGQVTDRVGK